ncbi:MAG: hypothetical protein WBM67_04665, partial [Sedimenticolaceae bacterium]
MAGVGRALSLQGSQRQEQATAAVGEASEAVTPIKGLGLMVDGIYDHGIDRDIVANRQGSFNRVGQKHLASPRT